MSEEISLVEMYKRFGEEVQKRMERIMLRSNVGLLGTIAEREAKNQTGLTMEHFEQAMDLIGYNPKVPALSGLHMHESKYLGESFLRCRERTWKERLFTLPWKPLKKQEINTVWFATGKFYYMEKYGVVAGHPDDMRKLREAFNAR